MRNSGFTLVEMLLVVAILAILLGFAVPPLALWYRGRAIRGAADQFVSAHTVARTTAVRFGRLAELHIDQGNNKFWVVVDTTDAGVQDTIGAMREMPSGVTFTSTRDLLCFDARGLPSERTTSQGQTCDPADVSLVFTSESETVTVTTTALGKVLR
jgi:prepilin-type N-terminal cleavage/methylation domain-containing protein